MANGRWKDPARTGGLASATQCVVALALGVLLAGAPAFAADRINVNSASAAELAQVPGIDATLAVRIVAQRAAHGPFHKLDDLFEVPGFTKLLMVQAAEHLEVGPPPSSAPVAPMGTAQANGGRKLDLNKASFRDLLLLPEMTPRGAKAIVDYREKNHGFQSVDELGSVPGLDKRLLVQLLDQVEVPNAGRATVAAAATPTPEDGTAVLGEGGWNGSWVSKLDSNATPTPAPSPTSKPALAPGERIDLNTAERDDLERLPDVGPVMSQRIVEYRTKNGPFKSVDSLKDVRGIGAQRLAAIRPYVTVSHAVSETAKVTRPAPTPRPRPTPVERAHPTATAIARTESHPEPSRKAILPDGRVNINVAGVEDLLTLPRMTREAAAEIVAFRAKNGPFHDPHSITDVPSIGEATYARIRDKITTGE